MNHENPKLIPAPDGDRISQISSALRVDAPLRLLFG
jgi:hypothetical protein